MYDGPNTANPYTAHHSLIGVLGVVKELDSGQNYKLSFHTYYEIGNYPDKVSAISIYNAAEDTTWNLSPDDSVLISFHQPGPNMLNITITLDNNATVSYKQTVFVNVLRTTGTCESGLITFTTALGFQGYNESYPKYGQGEFKIYYNTQTCSLQKPIIIMDGFDPIEVRKIFDIYGELSYNNYANNLGNELRAMGYDIVVLNFPRYKIGTVPVTLGATTINVDVYRYGGADFIERNAMVLISLIDSINVRLSNISSTEKLVIVGPSMGGLISRYALKYMQNNGWGHNTRLWISFDSPHWGANIPLGLQEMIRYFYKNLDVKSAEEFYEKQLRSPAARQLLIVQTEPEGPKFNNHNTPYHLAMENQAPFRVTWKNTLSSMGFPTGIRRVALVNGSYKGVTYHSQGGDMFLVRTRTNSYLTVLMSTPSFISTSNSEIVNVWKFGSGTDHSFYHYTNLPFHALDGCPGGMYDVQQEFYDATHGTKQNPPWPTGFTKTYVENMTNNATHIPTVSAIALNNPNFNWSNQLDKKDILCNNKSPFHNIYMPEDNERHVSLTPQSAAWVIQEIQKGQYSSLPWIWDCIWELYGENSVQTYAQENYNWGGYYPSGEDGDVEWSVSDNIDIIASSISGITIEAQWVAGGSFIEAKIINPYGADKIIRKDLTVTSNKNSNNSNNNRGTKRMIVSKDGTCIYPNPAQDVWNITIGKNDATSVSAELYDAMGIKVWEQPAAGKQIQLRNEHLPAGVYHLKLTVDKDTKTYKLLK